MRSNSVFLLPLPQTTNGPKKAKDGSRYVGCYVFSPYVLRILRLTDWTLDFEIQVRTSYCPLSERLVCKLYYILLASVNETSDFGLGR
jgi:hypothetical protein